MAALPYVTATGNVERALLAIKAAATPEKVNQDFVKTILKIPGGSGDQINSFLKKVGFVNADGAPSDIYKRFRNNSSTSAAATASLKFGYAPLHKRNEYWTVLDDDALRGLILEETGQSEESAVIALTVNSIKGIKKFITPGKSEPDVKPPMVIETPPTNQPLPHIQPHSLGLNVGYTINLNLPATSDIAVFNAIFKSLRENLLKSTDENG
jgi:hypothetical protein